MSQPYIIANPLLSGPFAPLREELDVPSLPVEGAFPPDLHGILFRIGPNPQFPPLEPYNPLQGDGMTRSNPVFASTGVDIGRASCT
jgi:carotenoid cleavage dioxygenase-like enzyme